MLNNSLGMRLNNSWTERMRYIRMKLLSDDLIYFRFGVMYRYFVA